MDDPCLSCKYRNQYCTYFLDGMNMNNACNVKLIWMKPTRAEREEAKHKFNKKS